MVVALGPGKFYGSSLPRPRFYTDVKFNDERVDPPAPVLDPLLSWATDAHWSMGGLSFKRLRLQGRIEGNVKKLQKERERILKKRSKSLTPIAAKDHEEPDLDGDLSDSPPPTPIVAKKRRRLALLEEEEEVREDVGVGNGRGKTRRLARKLGDDFDMVADDAGKGKRSPLKDLENVDGLQSLASRTRSRRSEVEEVKGSKTKGMKKGEEGEIGGGRKRNRENMSASPVSASPNGVRTSPRLSKLRSR